MRTCKPKPNVNIPVFGGSPLKRCHPEYPSITDPRDTCLCAALDTLQADGKVFGAHSKAPEPHAIFLHPAPISSYWSKSPSSRTQLVGLQLEKFQVMSLPILLLTPLREGAQSRWGKGLTLEQMAPGPHVLPCPKHPATTALPSHSFPTSSLLYFRNGVLGWPAATVTGAGWEVLNLWHA